LIDESEIVVELPDDDTSFMSIASEEENNQLKVQAVNLLFILRDGNLRATMELA
jgi:hypothetical protein